MATRLVSPRVGVARVLAEMLLDGQPDRWAHTIGVAGRAEELADTVAPDERDVLLVAAWLHDIGYAPAAAVSGFHPLDGAAYLDRQGWPSRISALVAHHSGADLLADAHGLGPALATYPDELSPVSDALTYADQTTGPTGQRLSIGARMAEMIERHGPASVQARVHHLRRPHLLAVAERVERRLADLDAGNVVSPGVEPGTPPS
jgi:putative nucleotidyltransferase with HDIG domain